MTHEDARPRDEDRDPDSYIAAARRSKMLGRIPEALAILRNGIDRCAPSPQLYAYYIERLEKCNRTEEAIATAVTAAIQFPGDLSFKLWEALILPVVYATAEDVEYYRHRYRQGLRRLAENLSLRTLQARQSALAGIGAYVNFYLGYQDGNLRDPQLQLGGVLGRIMAANYPQWIKPLPMPSAEADGKLRIGYVSSCFFESSSAMKNHLGWLREHTREQFSIYSYYAGSRVDTITEEVRRMSCAFHHLPFDLEGLSLAILADRLHILVYLDVGLRPITGQLASLRLAPVQCATWEAPYTTGLANVDYFISSELMEPENAQEHYSETLVLLPGVGVCYRKPVIPFPVLNKTRRDFGLREDAIVYLCCQAPCKYLPDYDEILRNIARQVPNSQFVFLAPNEFLCGDLGARLESAFKAVGLEAARHIVVLPTLDLLNYWNLHLICDVFLDTMGWSGGVSTFEAVACGLPVVTMPGGEMRSRHSYAILTQLGATETISVDRADYVDLAVRLGADRAWRRTILERMVQGYPRLYSDTRCVRALEEFFRVAVADRLRRPVDQSADTGAPLQGRSAE